MTIETNESASMNARLKVLHEKANIKSVKLLPVTVIGRSTECDLKIAASEVSRIHCRITVRDDAVYVEDLGSANGTFVNEQMLNPRQPVAVDPGTKISIGRAEFLVDYIAPHSNTVVIRRTDKDGKLSPAAIRSNVGEDSDELVFSSIPDATVASCSESTLVSEPKSNPFAAAKELIAEAISTEPPASPNPPAAVARTKESRNPIPAVGPVAKSPVVDSQRVVAATKSPTAPPVGAVAAKAIGGVAASPAPVAKAVPMAAKHSSPIPPEKPNKPSPEFPQKLDEPRPATVVPVDQAAKSRDAHAANADGSAPPARTIAPEPAISASENADADSVFDEATQFNFTEEAQSLPTTKPAPQAGKPGGIKSLFSAFSRKPPPVTSTSKESPPPAASEQPAEASADLPFQFGTAEPEASSDPPDKPAEDDDFQQFLCQF